MTNDKRYAKRHIANPVYVFTDSEWVGDSDQTLDKDGVSKVADSFLCTQCLYTVDGVRYKVLAIGHDALLSNEFLTAAEAEGFELVHVSGKKLIDQGVISLLPGLSASHEIVPVFYFSPLDLAYLVGLKPFKQMVFAKTIEKKRSHSLARDEVKLPCGLTLRKVIDLFGLNPYGAEKAAGSVGYPTPAKELSHGWDKSRMDIVAAEDPSGFVKYCAWDVEWMEGYSQKFPELVNRVREGLGIVTELSFLTMPHTVGALTFVLFYDWLKLQVPKLKSLKAKSGRPKDPSNEGNTTSGTYDHCLDGARVCVLAEKPGTIAYNAVVLGGRAVNERPACYYSQGRIADIDLSSCYGSGLRNGTYPVGLPSLYGNASESGWLTVKQFLDKYERELIPGLWQMTIEGSIPQGKEAKASGDGRKRGTILRSRLGQNLLMGKRVAQKDIDNARLSKWSEPNDDDHDYDDSDISKIPGTFALCTNKLEGVVVTHDLLDAIRKVATAKELGDFYKLKVKCAAWYGKSDMCESVEAFSETVINDPGKYDIREGSTTAEVIDTRTRAWFPVPLEGFSGRLVDMRNAVKKTDKPLSETLKLFVNATYGMFASPYFEVGNAVVANNITAKARLGVWMLSMSLGVFQSITDGGAYNLDTVRFLNAPARGQKKPKGLAHADLPGLTVFAELSLGDMGLDKGETSWQQKPSTGRYTGTLAVDCDYSPWDGQPLPEKSEEVSRYMKALDKAATNHINAFFAPYGLALPFSIEHKETTLANKWATYGKTDYALVNIWGEVLYKLRGAKDYRTLDGKQDLRLNYRYLWLDAVLDGKQPPAIGESDTLKLVSITQYLKLRPEVQTTTYPGCEIRTVSNHYYKPTNVPLPDMDAHEKWGEMSERELERRAMNEWVQEPEHLARRGYEATLGKHRDTIK